MADDPALGPDPDLGGGRAPAGGGRREVRPGGQFHRELEAAFGGLPVTALAAEERRGTERVHRIEVEDALDPSVRPQPGSFHDASGAREPFPHPPRPVGFSGARFAGVGVSGSREQVRRHPDHRLARSVERQLVVFFPRRGGAPETGPDSAPDSAPDSDSREPPEQPSGRPVESWPLPEMAETTLLLVDGNNLLFRSFFAMPRLTRSDGQPTGALHGFAATLKKILREEAPEFAAVAFDAPGSTFRHEAFAEYKANRPEMPAELARQVPFTRDLSRVLGVAVLEVAGVEADDVIGTLARAGSGRGYRVLIVSGDKDLLQLVDDRVVVVLPGEPERRLDPAGVEAKLGVPPGRVADYLALTGDSVDNIPGVPGIGPKTAVDLIASFGGVEEILARTGEIARKRTAALLAEHGDKARLSRELVLLRLDVAVPEAGAGTELDGLRYRGPRVEEARSFFEGLELRTHARDLAPPPVSRLPKVTVADGLAEVARVLARAGEGGALSAHAVFGPSANRGPAPLAALGLAAPGGEESGEAVLVPVGSAISEDALAEALRPLLAGGTALVGHGLQPFVRWWIGRGGRAPRTLHDSQVAAWLLNTTLRAREFPDVLRDYTGLALPEAPPAAKTLFGAAAPDERLAVAAAWQHPLRAKLDPLLDDQGLRRVFSEIEMPLLPVLAAIETRGVCLDSGALGRLGRDLEERLRDLTARIHELAGAPFDIQSPKQLGEILFDKLNLPQTAKTRKLKRASTRAAVLEELAPHHELPRLVLEYRELAKLKSTYVDPLPELVSGATGRLHTRLHQAVAATGRLSSSDPNLQNIPVRTPLGQQVRAAFVAAPGKRLISADYSQIELRILAHLSGDPALLEAFRSGEDIHARTAKEVFGGFGLTPAEARRRAKIVNFSVIYGKTAFTLGKEIGVSTGEAREFIEAYFDRYSRVRELIETIKDEARRSGRVTTLFGRQRHIPEIRASHRARREAAERMAVNAPIQGAAADLVKIAMLGVDRALEATSGELLLQVHDELLVEAGAGEAEAVGQLVRAEMQSAADLRVPLLAAVTISTRWEH